MDSINFWHGIGASIHPDGSVELTAHARACLIAPVFSMVGGAAHQGVGLCIHSRPFDFVLPERQELPLTEGAELILYDAVVDAIRERAQPELDLIRHIRGLVDGAMFQIESPPTYRDEVVPLGVPAWAAQDEPRISPPWFRYKLWRAHSSLVRAFCEGVGVTFVPFPPEGVDPQGFLLAHFYRVAGHANEGYGALVLKQILALAAGHGTATIAVPAEPGRSPGVT